MNVTMESCPKFIAEITSAINDLIHEYESLVEVMDNDTCVAIDKDDGIIISPKYFIEYDNLYKKADRIQKAVVNLSTSEFLDIEDKDIGPNARANIKFYSMQVDALQGMLDQATTSMVATEIDYFTRENMMPYIRYYERMNSEVCNDASEDKSVSDKSKSDDDASLNYIKSRSDKAFHADADERFNPIFKGYKRETFEV